MSSPALEGLAAGIEEVKLIQSVGPPPGKGLLGAEAVKSSLVRSAIVLLVSHLERFIYALNESAFESLGSADVPAAALQDELRLLHAKPAIDEIALMQWNHRAPKLDELMDQEARLWVGTLSAGEYKPDRALSWMKGPDPKSIRRYFRMWGVDDIFVAVTRSPITRERLWLRVDEVVNKRHNIAHGDATVDVGASQLTEYRHAVWTLADRSDRLISRRLARTFGISPPW